MSLQFRNSFYLEIVVSIKLSHVKNTECYLSCGKCSINVTIVVIIIVWAIKQESPGNINERLYILIKMEVYDKENHLFFPALNLIVIWFDAQSYHFGISKQ